MPLINILLRSVHRVYKITLGSTRPQGWVRNPLVRPSLREGIEKNVLRSVPCHHEQPKGHACHRPAPAARRSLGERADACSIDSRPPRTQTIISPHNASTVDEHSTRRWDELGRVGGEVCVGNAVKNGLQVHICHERDHRTRGVNEGYTRRRREDARCGASAWNAMVEERCECGEGGEDMAEVRKVRAKTFETKAHRGRRRNGCQGSLSFCYGASPGSARRTDDDGADEVHARAAGGRSGPQCPIRRGFPNQPHLENRATGPGQPRAGQRLGLGP